MFDICLFDLDDTLVRTTDLKEIREACKHNNDSERLDALRALISEIDDRHIYSAEFLQQIRTGFPQMKLGVFTRSPCSYTHTVLDWAYPGFVWDIVVTYESVEQTKPYGDGIDLAMETFSAEYLDRVILIGDSDVDVRASYHCGCVVVLSTEAWPYPRERTHWKALEFVPDAVINSPSGLLDVLSEPNRYLPELERLFSGTSSTPQTPRFDKINHFISKAAGGDQSAFPIYVAGRSFAKYKSLQYRKQWHALTASIEQNKESDVFPAEWIAAIRHFIKEQYFTLFGTLRIVVCVVPHRPGRKARLENLVRQLEQSVCMEPIERFEIICRPELLAYKLGVKSQHNEYLGRDERFMNVRDHLFVQNPEYVTGETSFLVIDDVTTTGASLIYAAKYLKAAGARDVKCLSMAKNIGDIV